MTTAGQAGRLPPNGQLAASTGRAILQGMAKNVKIGDVITLRWRVTGTWGDGLISATHPLYQAPIAINANEIPEEDVDRKAPPPKPAPRDVTYLVEALTGDGWRTILSTRDRAEADALAKEIGKTARIEEIVRRPKRK